MVKLFNKLTYRLKIYIVEYSPECVENLLQNLELPERARIAIFDSGEKFIRHISRRKRLSNKFSIAFIGYNFFNDKNQTLMNGLEILESVKKIAPDIEVVMLADESEKEYGGYVRQMGAYTFILKDDNLPLRANNIVLLLYGEFKLRLYRKIFIWSVIIWGGVLLATLLYLFYS